MRQSFSVGPSSVSNSSNFHSKTEVGPVLEGIEIGMKATVKLRTPFHYTYVLLEAEPPRTDVLDVLTRN